MLLIKRSVLSLKENNNTTLFFLHSNYQQVFKTFMSDQLNIIIIIIIMNY